MRGKWVVAGIMPKHKDQCIGIKRMEGVQKFKMVIKYVEVLFAIRESNLIFQTLGPLLEQIFWPKLSDGMII